MTLWAISGLNVVRWVWRARTEKEWSESCLGCSRVAYCAGRSRWNLRLIYFLCSDEKIKTNNDKKDSWDKSNVKHNSRANRTIRMNHVHVCLVYRVDDFHLGPVDQMVHYRVDFINGNIEFGRIMSQTKARVIHSNQSMRVEVTIHRQWF